jgi:chromosome segregation ATPase
MFAKRSKPPPAPQRPAGDASQTEPSGPDPRDATIERLSRELAAERDNLTTVREALDAATFKVEVLEKSYAKQLTDTRQRLAATEQSLAEKAKLLGALDGGHEDALRALNDARAEVKALTAERDELRKQIAQGGFRERGSKATRAPLAFRHDDGTDTGGTINELIKDAAWAHKPPAASAGGGHANAKVAEQDAPPEVMIAPDLVFTKDGDDADDER